MKPYILVFLLFSCIKTFAQEYYDVKFIARDTTQPVASAIAYWKKNDSHTYRFIQKEVKYNADTVVSEKIQTDYEMKFIVIDSTEKSYKIRWDYLKSLKEKTELEAEAESKLFASLYNKYQELQLIYNTDETGAMGEVENLPQLSKMMGEISDIVKKQIFDTLRFDSPKKKKAFEDYMSLFLNKDYLLKKTFIEPINQFHNLMGFSCHINDTLSFKLNTPNNINGGLITNEGYLFIESIDSTYEAQFIQELYPDEEQVNKMTFDYIKKTLGKVNKEYADLEKTTRYSVNDYNRYFINLNTGLPTFIKTIRELYMINIASGESKLQKQDILIIELKE